MTWIKPRISQPKRVWFIKRSNFLTIVVKSAIRNHFTDRFKLKQTIRLKFFFVCAVSETVLMEPRKDHPEKRSCKLTTRKLLFSSTSPGSCAFLPSWKTNSGQYIFFRRITVTDGFVKLKYFLLEKAVTTIISCDV